jgi:hypothetical protein
MRARLGASPFFFLALAAGAGGCGAGTGKADAGADAGEKDGSVQGGGRDGSGEAGADAPTEKPIDALVDAPGDSPLDSTLDSSRDSSADSATYSTYVSGSQDPSAPGFCEGRWCWSNPLPQGNVITGFWARGPNDVWASGEGNTLLRWDGVSWRRVPVEVGNGAGRRLVGVWGTPDGVHHYAVGNDVPFGTGIPGIPVGAPVLLHHDGQAWHDEWPATLGSSALPTAVSGTAADDVWVVGQGPLILHGDGHSFTSQPSANVAVGLTSVTAIGPSDVWATGGQSDSFHFDGKYWVDDYAPFGYNGIGSIWAVGADVWASASGLGFPPVQVSGALLQWNGAGWAVVPGSTFSNPMGSPGGPTRGSGTGPRDVWLADAVAAHHFDGDRWTDFSPVPNPTVTTLSVRAVAPGDAWLGGSGGLFHFDGHGLSPLSQGARSANIAVVGTDGAADAFVTGAALLQHSASGWTQASQPALADFVSTGPRDVWGFTPAGELFHWDGQSWSSLGNPVGTTVVAVAGSGPDDLWAFTGGPTACHYDGQKCTLEVAPLSSISDAWAAGPGDVWVAGEISNGDITAGIAHFTTAGGWQVAATPPKTYQLRAIWGSSTSDIWAAGVFGSLVHFVGGTWQTVAAPVSQTVSFGAVGGSSSKDVWVVGQFGVAMHWDGATLQVVDTGCGEDLSGVWVGPQGDAWAVGAAGAILHFH